MDEFLNHFGKGFRFLRPAFSHFFTGDSVEFFARLGVPTKVERGGRIFPESDNAQDLVDALVRNAKNQGATIQTGRRIRKIQFTGTGFELFSDQTYRGRHVVLATGGASYPATGSTGDGYALAASLGHSIVPPRPALIPLVTEGE